MSGHTTCSEAGPVARRGGGAFNMSVINPLLLAILLFRCNADNAVTSRVRAVPVCTANSQPERSQPASRRT